MTLKFFVAAMFVNITSQATRNTQYVAMFMIRLSTTFPVSASNRLLFFAILFILST